ncbi:Mss4-like protein [Kockiozyma suomiensis]|uniref:Mss4-like protein n=1 Tax=Kockiozyma suomiensis TaxID=1337062 RepID=UPI003343B7B4
MGEKVQYEDLVENIVDGTVNAHKLYCPYNNCSSLILSPGVGVLQRRPKIPKEQFPSKNIEEVRSQDTKETIEELSDEDSEIFWVLTDPFQFDNLGFSKSSTTGIKYLACADCDRGPLGYHDSNTLGEDGKGKAEYLLSATKVLYKQI